MRPAIAPGRVLDLKLGMTPEVVQNTFGDPQDQIRRSDGVGFFKYQYPGIAVTFYEGLANMLIVESPDIGKTGAGAFAGMPFRELERLVGGLYFGEGERLWRAADTAGIWYDIVRPPRDGEEFDPWLCAEIYVISDPERAVVQGIWVM